MFEPLIGAGRARGEAAGGERRAASLRRGLARALPPDMTVEADRGGRAAFGAARSGGGWRSMPAALDDRGIAAMSEGRGRGAGRGGDRRAARQCAG